jgi:hypothetical protein
VPLAPEAPAAPLPELPPCPGVAAPLPDGDPLLLVQAPSAQQASPKNRFPLKLRNEVAIISFLGKWSAGLSLFRTVCRSTSRTAARRAEPVASAQDSEDEKTLGAAR